MPGAGASSGRAEIAAGKSGRPTGERLSDIKQLEIAYTANNMRMLEITRHVSLR
jgi:hypothetical protein